MIKYIFLDWGYTIIDGFKDTDDEVNEILKPYNKTWKDLFKIWRNFYYLHSLGRFDSDVEKYEQMSKITGVSISDFEKIGKIILESHILRDEIKETLVYLKNKGYKLGIISNNIDEWVQYILKREQIEDLFFKVVCSSAVGERKPAANIYLKAFEDISKDEYENILFVSDELSDDISGAIAVGVKTAWVSKTVSNGWKQKEEEIFKTDYKIESVEELKNIL